MKRTFISVFTALVLLTANAGVVREGNTFKVEQTVKIPDKDTGFKWEDKEGKEYPIYITKKGACYVIKVSKKTGKEYRYYLPKETQEEIRRELNIE